jgi:hypothetical protein
MAMVRCPECKIPLSRAESAGAACPVCGARLLESAVPASEPAADERQPRAPEDAPDRTTAAGSAPDRSALPETNSGWTRLVLIGVVLLVVLMVGLCAYYLFAGGVLAGLIGRREQAALPRRPATQPAAEGPTHPMTRPADVARFDAELRRIVALEKQGDVTAAWKLALATRAAYFPRYAKLEQLNRAMDQLRGARQRAAELAESVKRLGSDVPKARQIAAAKLVDSGAMGAVLLREAVRTGPDAVAAKAAELLAKLDDAKAAAALHERLKAGPAAPLRSALLRALRDLVGRIPPEVLGELYASARDRPLAGNVETYAVLAAAVREAAGGDARKFAAMVGDPEAGERLKARIAEAVRSGDPATSKAASEMLAHFGAVLGGLRGSYYTGRNFEKLASERLDATVEIDPGKLSYPDKRTRQLSIRWTGRLRAPAAGKYTFFASTNDGVCLWVAGRKVIDHWASRSMAESAGEAQLQAGLRPIKMEFFQADGPMGARLEWAGPGIQRKVIGPEHLTTAPWRNAAGG